MHDSAYGKYGDWKGWSERKFGQYEPEVARYYEMEMSLAGLFPLANRSILEIGFGNGEFAQWATQLGAKYAGTEILEELVEAGVAAGFRMYSGACPLDQIAGINSLDGVVAFDVFEHLDLNELHQALSQIYFCLMPGGLIVGRVPSGDSPFARAIQYGDITHKTALGSSAIRQIATRCGYEVLQTRSPVYPIRSQGLVTSMRRAMVVLARGIVFPILRTVFLGNSNAVLTPNMIFVLRKPT